MSSKRTSQPLNKKGSTAVDKKPAEKPKENPQNPEPPKENKPEVQEKQPEIVEKKKEEPAENPPLESKPNPEELKKDPVIPENSLEIKEEKQEGNVIPKQVSNPQIENIEIYNNQNINKKSEPQMKNLKALGAFFTSAPKSIVEKSKNDSQKFTQNYTKVYEQQKPSETKKKGVLNFFTGSFPLISLKTQGDVQNLGKNFSSCSTPIKIFLSFLSKSPDAIIQKTKTDFENLKRRLESPSQTNDQKKKQRPSIKFTEENDEPKDFHKKYPKSPLKKGKIKTILDEEIKDQSMSMSVLAEEEEKLKRLKEYKEFKEILKKQLQDLQSEIKGLKSTLTPMKGKDEILNDPLKPHLKKRILISDDGVAKKQAEFLVAKLNKERKLKEQKKMKEIENMGKNLKENIESIKKERHELEKLQKNEKKNQYLNRLHEVKAKKEFLMKGNINPLELLNQFKNTSELNESLVREKIKGSPDLLIKKKEELNKIRDMLKNK